jgi:hypothetical protein
MNTMTIEEMLHETLVLRLLYEDTIAFVCVPDADPDQVPLADVLRGIQQMGTERFAALAFLHRYAQTMAGGRIVAEELRVLIRQNRRPRTVRQLVPRDVLEELALAPSTSTQAGP